MLLRYLGTLDLISWELDLGSWRFLFGGFVWGLFWGGISLIWRLSLSLVGVDRWKQAHKHAQETCKKNSRRRGQGFCFGHQGRIKAASHYSLAVQA